MQCLLHPTPSPSKCWAPRSGPRAGEHPHLHRTPRHGQYPTFRDTATLTVPHLHGHPNTANTPPSGHPNTASTPPSRTPQHCQHPRLYRTPQHSQYPTFRTPQHSQYPASTGHPNTASTPPSRTPRHGQPSDCRLPWSHPDSHGAHLPPPPSGGPASRVRIIAPPP